MLRYVLVQNPIVPLLIFLSFALLCSLLFYVAVKPLLAKANPLVRKISIILIIGSAAIFALTLITLYFFRKTLETPASFVNLYYATGTFVVVYVPIINLLLFRLFEIIVLYIFQLSNQIFKSIRFNTFIGNLKDKKYLVKLGLIAIPVYLGFIIHGICYNRFDFHVKNYDLYFDNLPKNFEGFTVLQFSDLHIGSFIDHKKELEKAIDLINQQHVDIIVFTGDFVNFTANEIDSLQNVLKKMNTPAFGKYSILGNHDYGDYRHWESLKAKIVDLRKERRLEKELGFKLLLNESDSITKNGQSIGLIGVENWGLPPMPQHGDYNLAVQKVKTLPFKILLSHDPIHWVEKIKDSTDVALTLSGHTHGAQFAINFAGFQWSPIRLRYKYWMGMYQEKNQYINVNVGLGFAGYPGRVGTAPEISIIKLHKNN